VRILFSLYNCHYLFNSFGIVHFSVTTRTQKRGTKTISRLFKKMILLIKWTF